MVESPLKIETSWYIILVQESGDPIRQIGISRGWISDFVGFIGKAIIIV